MTSDLLTVKENNGIAFALREMRKARVRRAPVVNDAGALVGVLSIDDAIDHIAAQLGDIASLIRHEQQAELRARP
jgi:CBS domain-containing protein